MTMEMQHCLRQRHPLKLLHLGEDDNGQAAPRDHKGIRTCAGCPDVLSGQVYACDACGLYLHESCANLPQKMEHPFHPCPLFLHFAPISNEGAGTSSGGERQGMMLSYRCEACSFEMDAASAQFQLIDSRKEENLYPSHEHPLKLSFEEADADRYCDECRKPISGKCYGCHSCGYYLHEICATLPHEIRHFFHPCILFLKETRKRTKCDACRTSIMENSSYHCEKCDFYMHVECTKFQPITSEDGGDWILDWSHHHPLRLFGPEGKSFDDFLCQVCGRETGETSYATCELCGFQAHKYCVGLPREIQHVCHPCRLFGRVEKYFQCNACSNRKNVCIYHCKECHFHLDVKCALLSQEIAQCDREEHILRYCHIHFVQLFNDLKRHHTDRFFNRKFECLVCTEPASGMTYGCKRCSIYIHKLCLGVLSQTVSMKDCFLFLMNDSRFFFNPSHNICEKCKGYITSDLRFCRVQFNEQTLCYWCIPCSLEEAISIRISTSSIVTKLHFHPCSLTLKLFSTFFCNACFTHCHTHAYQCSKCEFYVGFKCAQLSKKRRSEPGKELSCHWHPLQHLQDMKVSTDLCKVCGNLCLDSSYFCKECNSHIHRSCLEKLHPMIDKHYFNWTLILLTTSPYKCIVCQKEDHSGLTFRSIEDGFKLCIDCVLWPKSKLNNNGTFTSVHHWHILALVDNLGQDVNCLLCKGKSSALMYHCNQCKEYFHKVCAELPFNIQHPLHQGHFLTLTSSLLLPESRRSCSLCLGKLIINNHHSGVYHCKDCSFQLDKKCATHIPSIQYGGHPHLLSIVENMHGQEVCQICFDPCPRKNELFTQNKVSNYAFRCVECNFTLHLECGPLPNNIKHPCHVHSLMLEEFNVEENYTDKFVCHVCEELRNPRLPVYHCADSCPMICEITCVISEVMPKLLGDHGDIELRTIYPNVTSKVIHKDKVLKAKTDFSRNVIASQVTSNNHYQKFDREDEDEDEDQNIFEFSKEAFIHFSSKGCTPPPLDEYNLPDFVTQYKDLLKLEGEHKLPHTLVPIYREFFHKCNMLSEICYDDRYTFEIFTLCALLHNMRMTKLVDVSSKRVHEWLSLLKWLEDNEVDIRFMFEKIKIVWEAHFLIKAKEIVDDKSHKLQKEASQLEREEEFFRKKLEETREKMEKNKKEQEDHNKYVGDGMKGLRKELTDVLLIKWKPASSVILFDDFANALEWNGTEEDKSQGVNSEVEENEDKDEPEFDINNQKHQNTPGT